jgi:hypothetical protein
MTLRSTLILFPLLCSCASGIEWTRHMALRAYGKGLALSEIDPDEQVKAAVRPQLDYVSVSVERVFFKDVPVALSGSVAVGLEVTGLAPGNRAVKTVLGVKSIGASREVRFDEAIALQPTLYTGREVTISLHFRRMPGSHTQAALGRVQGSWDLLRKIDPALPATLDQPLNIFQQVMEGPATAKEPLWSYQTTFIPFGAIRDKPDRIFTAARHILVLLPPSNTSGAWGRLKPSDIPKFLKVEGGRLLWRHTGREYEATPHIIVNVRRYRRYPRETEVEKFLRRADVLYEQGPAGGFFLLGRIALMSAAEALVHDRILTSQEKNLVREWLQFRHRRYDSDEARSKSDKNRELENYYAQIRSLGVIRQEFGKILYPFEVKDIEYKVASLARRVEALAAELGVAAARLDDLLNTFKLKERVIELTKTKFKDRVIRVAVPQAEQFGAPPDDPTVTNAGVPSKTDPAIVDIAASALAAPPDQRELEEGVKRPFYRKWWFWTVVGVAVVGAAAGSFFALKREYRSGREAPFGPVVPLGRP